MRRPPALLTPLAAVLTGCSASDAERTAVTAAALRSAGHAEAARSAAARRLLAPATREALTRDPGPSCEPGVSHGALPAPGRIRATDAYGRRARVVLEHDTYFVTRFPDGWKVRAADCTPRPERPYDCRVKGD
ncbi:hypothetical protein [Streptomyces roseolilacinus]|uniref:hypothetical protein n=1 Tax=Streptomyces roseolilacinus TaxID=66904 RepID=UPI00382F13E9